MYVFGGNIVDGTCQVWVPILPDSLCLFLAFNDSVFSRKKKFTHTSRKGTCRENDH